MEGIDFGQEEQEEHSHKNNKNLVEHKEAKTEFKHTRKQTKN